MNLLKMKPVNKISQQKQRNHDKSNNTIGIDADNNVRKGVDRNLNYLSKSNRYSTATRAIHLRGHRTSDDGVELFHHRRKAGTARTTFLDKQQHSSETKLKYEGTKPPRPKMSTIPNYVRSPRRNGLSPRDFLDENEEDENEDDDATLRGALQQEFEKHLAMGGGGGGGHGSNRCNRSHLSIKRMHKPTYSCSSCGARFHIKSLLGAHRRTHDDDFKVRFRGRRLRDNSPAIPPAVAAKQCKFCDRYFDLERALRIHQMCHCNKITPLQRRKLGYTDLAHEKKNAPLPNFQRMPRGTLPMHTVPDPNMPYVALGPAALKMIEQEQQMKTKRRAVKYTVKVAGPMGRWR